MAWTNAVTARMPTCTAVNVTKEVQNLSKVTNNMQQQQQQQQ